MKPEYFVKHVAHRALYEKCVLSEFHDMFTYDSFLKCFPFMMKHLPSNVMNGHKIRTMIWNRYVEEFTITECIESCGVTRGEYYYWSKKGIDSFADYINSLLLTSPLAVILLLYRNKNLKADDSIIGELYETIIKRRIGVAEFLFSAYGNNQRSKRSRSRVKYEDGTRPDYSVLMKDDPNFIRDMEFNEFAEFVIDYITSEDGEWVGYMVKLFEKNKPFYKELVPLLDGKRFPQISH